MPLMQHLLFALPGLVGAIRFLDDPGHYSNEIVEDSSTNSSRHVQTTEQKTFVLMDMNGDGHLSENELAAWQMKVGCRARLASVRAGNYLACADLDKDGGISLKEFTSTAKGPGQESWEACVSKRQAPEKGFFTFGQSDKNLNNKLEQQEIVNSFHEIWGPQADGMAAAFITCCDNDGDGSLCEYEHDGCGGHYNPVTQSWGLLDETKQRCLKPAQVDFDHKLQFRIIDANGDGKISKGESYAFISTVGPSMEASKADDLFRKFDTDKNDFLSYQEFLNTDKPPAVAGAQSFFLSHTGDGLSDSLGAQCKVPTTWNL